MTSEGTPPAGEWAGETPVSRDHPTFDASVAHQARVYNYWLGGKDNYLADRMAGDAAIEAYPNIVFSVRANRAFLARAVRYLAGEAGIQ
ncbi:MAG TPA: SAM-dependent methyltransferase, partial [Streptosporangiaceae bacterium]